jgi:hypothetical protein
MYDAHAILTFMASQHYNIKETMYLGQSSHRNRSSVLRSFHRNVNLPDHVKPAIIMLE